MRETAPMCVSVYVCACLYIYVARFETTRRVMNRRFIGFMSL